MMMIGSGMPITHKSTERMEPSFWRWLDNRRFTWKFQTQPDQNTGFLPHVAKPLMGEFDSVSVPNGCRAACGRGIQMGVKVKNA